MNHTYALEDNSGLQGAAPAQAGWKSRLLLGAIMLTTLAAVVAPAHAQYVWLDDKGQRQYSDRSPPASVPTKRIIKAPNLAALHKQAADTETSASADATATPAKGQPTVAQLNASYEKRKKEAAEQEKKSAQEAAHKAVVASNCEALREQQRALDSGQRIATVNKDGGREYMGDQERAQRSAKTREQMGECN